MVEWSENAAFDALWDKHVPTSGEADTDYGEAIRAVGRLEYDYYNNGYMNAKPVGNKFSDTYDELWLKLFLYLNNNRATQLAIASCSALKDAQPTKSYDTVHYYNDLEYFNNDSDSESFHNAIAVIKQWLVDNPPSNV